MSTTLGTPSQEFRYVDTAIGALSNRNNVVALEEFKPGEVTRAKRNPNYFRDTWFDEVEILGVVASAASHLLLFDLPPR